MQTYNLQGLTTFTVSASILVLAACNSHGPEPRHQTPGESQIEGPVSSKSDTSDTRTKQEANVRRRSDDDRFVPGKVKEHDESEARTEEYRGNRERLTEHPIAQLKPQPANEPVAATRELSRKSMADAVVGGLIAPPSPPPHGMPQRHPSEPVDRENYAHLEDNGVKLVAEHPVSTFSIDVDTGSYSNLRRFLKQGRLPPEDAVRVEEMINYFDYAYAAPRDRHTPFGVITELAVTPWNANTRLLHVGIQGWEPRGEAPPANLVFLIDVSGSMRSQDKLPLLKNAMKLLTKQMDGDDRISMVVYAGGTGVVLEPTPGNQHAQIVAALDRLQAGGRTNGAAGIRQAYAMAEQGFIQGGINRVILCTDGDFNVGTVNFEQLIDLVERKRENNISLTTLGFGTGNYNEHLMEQLADKGNGNYGYIDSLNEAQKLLVDGMRGTLETIAKDVKIQIEFNPNQVAEYRLIGYENRMLKREDFNNDRIDAGEIGAGHSVTALYEVAMVGSGGMLNDPLRYGKSSSIGNREASIAGKASELAFLRLRYKAPTGKVSKLIEQPLRSTLVRHNIEGTSEAFRFAAAVAAFGQRLRGGKYTGSYDYDAIRHLASNARGNDPHGYRGEFLQLVSLAQSLDHRAGSDSTSTAHYLED